MARKDTNDDFLIQTVAKVARPMSGGPSDFDRLLELVGNARFVLIGEATHGTHEFYRLRAQITKRLILEKGFSAVAAEADWPDAYRVNRFVRGIGTDVEAIESLRDFTRFPAWMWRNADVLDFVGWLRTYNEEVDRNRRVGFYGLDLYSLHASMAAVVEHLEKVDTDAARRARFRYSCFDHLGEDAQAYGYAASFGLTPGCARQVIAQLVEMHQRRQGLLEHEGFVAEDEAFQAEQNARVVKNAEEYYRTMFEGRVSSWNLRDTHMADTLDALAEHLDLTQGNGASKIVVWAHNSHVGDARVTEMGRAGEVNIGQLTRERHPGETCLIGFSTFAGSVTAASQWGGAAERKQVRPGIPGSYEDILHRTGLPSFVLVPEESEAAWQTLHHARLQRAIGVVYLPETERVSHYFRTRLPEQFDAILHIDHTRAVEPLERTAIWEKAEVPETYPTGY